MKRMQRSVDVPATCKVCDAVIERERAALLLTTCKACAEQHTPRRKAYMEYGHKTAGEIVYAEGDEAIRQCDRAYRRAR